MQFLKVYRKNDNDIYLNADLISELYIRNISDGVAISARMADVKGSCEHVKSFIGDQNEEMKLAGNYLSKIIDILSRGKSVECCERTVREFRAAW